MFVSLKANKKRILAFAVLALAVVAACVFLRWQGQAQEPEPTPAPGETNEERVAFLTGFGWQVEQEPTETREVMIPAQFNDVYQNYNAMQQAQGFDLAPYAGEVCTQYKYHVTNYPNETEVYATLLVYGRLIIGGDLACAEVDGFMHGFAKDSARYGEATPQPQQSAQPETSQAESESSYVTSSAVESSAPESSTQQDTAADLTSSTQDPVLSESQPEGADAAGTVPEDIYPTD